VEADDDGDVLGTRYLPGCQDHRLQRGGWETSTLSAALEHCAVARVPMVVLQHYPRHWQALLPCHPDRRVATRLVPLHVQNALAL
jgi:hypothetical protein